MEPNRWNRRGVLWGISAMAGTGILAASVRPATAQQVKYSSGAEPPKLKGAGQRLRLPSPYLRVAI